MLRDWRIRLWPSLAVACLWLCIVAALVVIYILDDRIGAAGYSELNVMRGTDLFFLAPILSAAVVGSVLIIHRPRQAVGWLFFCLSLLILASGIAEGYAAYANVAKPGALPLAEVAAVVDDKSFIPWLVVLTLILLHIPSGEIQGKASTIAAITGVAGGAIAFAAGLLSPYDGLLEPEAPIANPLALT